MANILYPFNEYDDTDDDELTGSGDSMIDEEDDNTTDTDIQDSTTDTDIQDNTTDTDIQDSTTDTDIQDSTTDTDIQDTTTDTDIQDTTTTISKAAYTEEDVKNSQFGSIYKRLTSDGKESQCAEFLAPQLMKQDRLFKHTYNAAFGSFY